MGHNGRPAEAVEALANLVAYGQRRPKIGSTTDAVLLQFRQINPESIVFCYLAADAFKTTRLVLRLQPCGEPVVGHVHVQSGLALGIASSYSKSCVLGCCCSHRGC